MEHHDDERMHCTEEEWRRVRPQVARYLGLAHDSEEQLVQAFLVVAERHEREPGVVGLCRELASWSQGHLRALHGFVLLYGAEHSGDSERVRGALHGVRRGGFGLLRDLHDLTLLVQEVQTSWMALHEVTGELHDKELEIVSREALQDGTRQLAWLRGRIKSTASQALVPSATADAPAEAAGRAVRRATLRETAGPALAAAAAVAVLAAGLVWIISGRRRLRLRRGR